MLNMQRTLSRALKEFFIIFDQLSNLIAITTMKLQTFKVRTSDCQSSNASMRVLRSLTVRSGLLFSSDQKVIEEGLGSKI